MSAAESQPGSRLYFVRRVHLSCSSPRVADSQQRAAYYRKLFARLDAAEARDLIDRLQILALTRPDTVKELETFLERDEPPNAPRKNDASDVAPVPVRNSGR